MTFLRKKTDLPYSFHLDPVSPLLWSISMQIHYSPPLEWVIMRYFDMFYAPSLNHLFGIVLKLHPVKVTRWFTTHWKFFELLLEKKNTLGKSWFYTFRFFSSSRSKLIQTLSQFISILFPRPKICFLPQPLFYRQPTHARIFVTLILKFWKHEKRTSAKNEFQGRTKFERNVVFP